MYCPVCREVQLLMMDRQGIEIDYCPQCRGIWLDRGELDKLLERAAQPYQPASTPQQPPAPNYPVQPPPSYQQPQQYNQHYNQHHNQHHNQHGQHYDPHYGHYKRKKRESFLDDLFDFD